MILFYFFLAISPLMAVLLFEQVKKVSSYLASSFLALYFTGILYFIDVLPLTNAIMRVSFFSLLILFVCLDICFPQSEKDKFFMEIYNVAFQDLFPYMFFINSYGVFLIIPLGFLNYLNIISSNVISIFLLLALIFILVRQYVLRPYIIKSIVKVTSNADYSPFKDGQKR